MKDKDAKKPKPTRRGKKAAAVLENQSAHGVPSDVDGSYTGSPVDDDRPVQDADDL